MRQRGVGGSWRTGMAVSAALVIQSEVLDQLYNPLRKKKHTVKAKCVVETEKSSRGTGSTMLF